MRYRALDANGDSTFGSGKTQFLVNSPAAVAQAVQTRLLLMTGEWWLDTSEGTPYAQDVLGNDTKPYYDLAIQERILNTQGVSAILDYQSTLDANRNLKIPATVDTIYSSDAGSTAPINITL